MSRLFPMTRLTPILAAVALMLAGAARAETVVSVTDVAYDVQNRPVCTTVRMNPAVYGSLPSDACTLGTASPVYGQDRITKTVYDAAGQAVQVKQAVGTTVERVYSTAAYSNNGMVTDSIDANGNRTHMAYDGVDRLITYNYPSTTRPNALTLDLSSQVTALSTAGAYSTTDYEAYTYDPNSNRKSTRRRDAAMIYDCYDALNRVVKHIVSSDNTCPATGGAKDVYTSYDGLGRITNKRFASSSGSGVSYTYDGLGRVASTTDAVGRTLAYGYNIAGARTSMTLADSTVITYTLDNANRVKSASHSTGGALFSQAYDNKGLRKKLLRGAVIAATEYNDLACVTATNATCYTYDASGDLITLANDLKDTNDDISWSFTVRNPANQILKWSASSANYDYVEPTSTTVAQAYDGLNRDAGIATLSDGYDARGNITHDTIAGNARYFEYDLENRLLKKRPASTGTADLTLVYDAEGRLAKYSTDDGATYTSFVYDGVNLIAEYSNAGALTNTYVHGTGTDEPIVWFNGSGYGSTIKRFFVSNYQGSIMGWTNDAGARQATYKYDAYGRPMDASNAEDWSGARFRYTGQTMLYEARLYYYKARVYDPVYGHFMQTDPIGSKDDLDLYAYVGGDPINQSDPTGLVAGVMRMTDGASDLASDYAEATEDRPILKAVEGGLNSMGGGNGDGSAAVNVPTGTPTVDSYARAMFGADMTGPTQTYTGIMAVIVSLWGGPESEGASELVVSTRMLAASAQVESKGLTVAGKAVTKHPTYFGYQTTEELQKANPGNAALNRMGKGLVDEVLKNGIRTTGAGGRYPDGWITYTLPDGRAASWSSVAKFIGFRGLR